MIISKDTNPEKDLYFLGAMVIDALQATDETNVDYLTLMNTLRSKLNITNSLFVLSLDWLYLLGLIDLSEEGNIKKCF
jgi:hypothetical protein